MAIEIAADFRRLTRAAVWSLAGILTLCAAAMGQVPLVSVGSVVPIPINTNMNQVYKILFYKGNALALDTGADVLYQLPPGATSWSNISGPARGGFLGGGYNSNSMALDAQGTLYISVAVPPKTASTALFWRFPYDAAKNTWDLSIAGAWGGNIIDPNNTPPTAIVLESGQGTVDVQFQNSAAMDGSGTLYFVASQNQIFSIAVDSSGNPTNNGNTTNPTATPIVNALNGGGTHMAVDAAGNIYFVEGHAISTVGGVRPAGTTGIWFIPAGVTGITGSNGSAEAYLQGKGWRVDNEQESIASPVVYAGVTLDAAGNLYMTSETNSGYAETFAGVWELPNVCNGAPPTAANLNTCMDDGQIALLAPISANQPLAIDSRGYFWIPTYQQYSPSGEASQSGVYSIVVFAPGVINLNYPIAGPSPTGTTGPAGILYVSFNGTYQPSGFDFSSASGSASQFKLSLTDPLPNTANTTPTVPCNSTKGNAGGLYNTFSVNNSCLLWVTLTPTVPGAVSAKLTMYSTGNPDTTVYVSGTGQGAGVAMLNSPQLSTLAAPTALNTPGQVAADSLGNTWVVDPAKKQVLYFPAGSSNASGTPVGKGLSNPTGVAVDGAGDIYIADWNSSKKLGTVYEIPWVPKDTTPPTYSYGTQIALSTKAMGLGNNLNLAVNGTGDVYVADPQNARVVKIPTPAQATLVVNPNTVGDTTAVATVTVGSAFTAPSAVAVDSTGNVYVADGTSLYQISAYPFNAQTDITDSLPGAVTGLAVDASGSVIAAISGQGLYRIPYTTTNGVGALHVNGGSLIDTSFTLLGDASCGGPGACTDITNVTSPEGVALDQQGNIFVTDMTGGTPNLYEMNVVNGFLNYGVGLTPLTSYQQDLDLFNIGNESLKVSGPTSPISFAGPDVAYYSMNLPSQGTACDTSGDTLVDAGTSCSLLPTFTPPALAADDLTPNIYAGDSLSIPTNASNIGGSGTAVATLQAASINNLETTITDVHVTLTQDTYPGSASVTVNIAPDPNAQYKYDLPKAPTGTVVLTLSCASAGCTQASIVESAKAALTGSGQNTSVTFNNLPALDGGDYNVTAVYQGSVLDLMAKSSDTVKFTVNRATPVITLSEPVAVAPNGTDGVIYLLVDTPNTLVANVSSNVGTPTGTVTLTEPAPDGTQLSIGNAIYGSAQNWTFSTVNLAVAAYSVTANYNGDENFLPAQTTVPVTFKVIPLSVLLTASPASITTKAGTPVSTTITIQSLVGFSAPAGANITCNVSKLGAPDFPGFSECTFSNPQPAINIGVPATTELTLSTNIPVNILPTSASNTPSNRPFRSPLDLAGIFGLGILGLALRKKAIVNRYLLNLVCVALFLAGAVMGTTSCTNGGYTKTPPAPHYTTPAGTYNISIQVTNTSTGEVESLPFKLTATIQ